MGGQVKEDPYFNSKRAQIILSGVLLVHVSVIAVPLIYSSLTDYFNPPPIVMKVGLADLPLGDSPDAGQPLSADTPAVTDSDPVLDLPPDPQKVDPLPDLPPSPPKVDPPKVEQKKDPPKTETKVTPKNEQKKDPPKTETKVTPKNEQKKDTQKWTGLKPEDIIKPKNNTRTQAQADADKKAREAAEASARARQGLIDNIRKSAGTYGTPTPGQEGILATEDMLAYYDQLNNFLRPQWTAVCPSSIELGSNSITDWPVVELSIAKDGRVTKSVIISQSGNKKINEAVKVLLAKLNVVPVPPKKQATTIRVTLDIR